MPKYWQFPTVSMGLGPIQAIYQAHIMKYLHSRVDRAGRAQGLASSASVSGWAICAGRHLGTDLAQVRGSGPKGRILKEDLQAQVKHQLQSGEGTAAGGAGIPGVELPDFSQFGSIERRPMNRIQKLTATGMQRSWLNVPHVTQFEQAYMSGACFTITSLGGIGGTAFTPIVNTPEVAILGVSKAATQPVWDGTAFQPRLMLPLSLSYDHRAINGADAARFSVMFARVLGDPRELVM